MKFYFLIACLFLSSCAGTTSVHGDMPFDEKIALIKPEQSKAFVEQTLGSPSFNTIFGQRAYVYLQTKCIKKAFFRPEVIERKGLYIAFDAKEKVKEVHKFSLKEGNVIALDTDKTLALKKPIGKWDFFLKHFGKYRARPM
ncbi:MAG: outer membrane protein assembly factor BamE [Alphaproteobacteria bacterium]|nr:outer membrane protein assembly factor BamE [Alphaproteobacteria bacterium]